MNKRLTYKQSIDGYTDVGLCEGVTIDEAICKLADIEDATDNNVGHKWISVKDRLPENRDDVLLCRKWWNEIRNPQMGWYNEVSRSWFDLSNREIHNVTHWMPLPEPPKGE
jgi:hypothetical protein